jgi:putative effector of murein hydrolase LrgA (UPF0299 family)
MRQQIRIRLWVELALAAATVGLALLTLALPTWIETLFRVDPDAGSGSIELGLVFVLASASLSAAVAANRESRRRPADAANT